MEGRGLPKCKQVQTQRSVSASSGALTQRRRTFCSSHTTFCRMALTASRSCSLRLRLSTAPGPAFATCTQSWRVASRKYATESAVYSSRRGAPSAKSTHKTTNVSSAAPKKVSAKVEKQAAGHGTSAAAEVRALSGMSKPKPEKSGPIASKGRILHATGNTEATKKLTPEEHQLQELEAIEYFKKVMKSADPFGQPIASSLGAPFACPYSTSTYVPS